MTRTRKEAPRREVLQELEGNELPDGEETKGADSDAVAVVALVGVEEERQRRLSGLHAPNLAAW